MECANCNNKFRFNEESVRLYYFDKTLYFCTNNCYYKYFKSNPLSYWKWIKIFYSLSSQQKEKHHKNLKKVENQIKKLKEKYGDTNKAFHAQHDLIWIKPAKPGNWFNHVSEYQSFKDFEKAVVNFLEKDTLQSIYENSWNFFCHHKYNRSWQLKQIKAVNRVFDELYGKGIVRWGFFEYIDSPPDKYNKFWGPYIVINEESYFLDINYRYSLNTFIKRWLRNEKNHKK